MTLATVIKNNIAINGLNAIIILCTIIIIGFIIKIVKENKK